MKSLRKYITIFNPKNDNLLNIYTHRIEKKILIL